jgi:NAD+ synthase (glutamine-hydrolysing)
MARTPEIPFANENKEQNRMRLVKIGMANINTTVGAIDSNIAKVTTFAEEMAKQKCTFGVFQEQVLSGYPPEDLPQWQQFVDKQKNALINFAEKTKAFPFKTTYIVGTTIDHRGNLYNCASVVRDGEILGLVPKEKLPTYGIFYEGRVFSAGTPGKKDEVTLNSQHANIPFGDLVFDSPSTRFGIEVCEDAWSPDGPMKRRAYSDAELIFNISASPWRQVWSKHAAICLKRDLLITK